MTDETQRKITLFSTLRRTTHLMVGELVERLIANGYPDTLVATHPVFENIDRDGTRLTELAARANMTHQSMGELVAALEQRGYLERRPDPADGRARLVCLTSKGRQAVRVALREMTDIEANWSKAWRAAGLRADLRSVLEHALREIDAPQAQPPTGRRGRATPARTARRRQA